MELLSVRLLAFLRLLSSALLCLGQSHYFFPQKVVLCQKIYKHFFRKCGIQACAAIYPYILSYHFNSRPLSTATVSPKDSEQDCIPILCYKHRLSTLKRHFTMKSESRVCSFSCIKRAMLQTFLFTFPLLEKSGGKAPLQDSINKYNSSYIC